MLDKECLKRIEGKYYKVSPEKKYMRVVKYDDYHLIGRTIYLRSAAKCKCKDGICEVCFGELSEIIRGLNAGILSSSIISSDFTQRILSSKHLLMTKSDKIHFKKGFEKYFDLDRNEIIFHMDNSESKNLYIRMNRDDFNVELDEFSLEYKDINYSGDDEYVVSEELQISKFQICNNEKTVIDNIEAENEVMMNVTDYMYDLINRYSKGNKKNIYIPLSAIDENETVFSIDINNAELTKTLNLVKDLFEKSDHLGCHTIDEIENKMNELLVKGKIYANIIHCEVLIRNLIRSVNNEFEFPDLENGEEYEIYTVKKALMHHKSPLLSLGFERIKEQIKGTLLFKKHGSCIFDDLFREAYINHYDLKKKDFTS